jgi:hypothetical protein
MGAAHGSLSNSISALSSRKWWALQSACLPLRGRAIGFEAVVDDHAAGKSVRHVAPLVRDAAEREAFGCDRVQPLRFARDAGLIRRKPEGARRGPSKRCRTGWSTTSGSPGSRRSKRPTPSCARSICPPTTPASPPPAAAGSAFVPIHGVDLDEILCVQEERQVGNDNCVSFRTLKLQIPESLMRPHFVKARVNVHLYPDGSHALFHGPRCIGRYDKNGTIRDVKNAA